ncbi:MAG: 50S ribosomal protein L29 [Proteobacteria bacterium]|nr:50S ribosomal protein L29 [Pseudomonadota bacterium]
MKASEFRKKNKENLKQIESDLLRESFNLQMQKATGQLTKPDQINKLRKDIARIYTVLTEKGKQE